MVSRGRTATTQRLLETKHCESILYTSCFDDAHRVYWCPELLAAIAKATDEEGMGGEQGLLHIKTSWKTDGSLTQFVSIQQPEHSTTRALPNLKRMQQALLLSALVSKHLR